jgi:hypothetical protein
MPLPFVFALVLGGSTPRACLRRNWTVSDSLPILRISSLHLASRCSYNPPRAPRLPKAAPSARRKSSSLDSELPSDPPPAEEDELVRSRSARDTLLARETRRLDVRFRNELRKLVMLGESINAGSLRMDLDVTACSLVEWEGAAMRTRVASVCRSRAWNWRYQVKISKSYITIIMSLTAWIKASQRFSHLRRRFSMLLTKVGWYSSSSKSSSSPSSSSSIQSPSSSCTTPLTH